MAAIVSALVSLAGVGAVAYVALGTARGQELDDRAMRVLSVNGDPAAARTMVELLERLTVGSAALALLVFVTLALLRRSYAAALAAAVLVAGANVTTQLLKAGLSRPDFGHGTLNSLPSGHTTLMFSLVLAAILVAPSALRGAVTMAGTAAGTLTGVATVVAGWHRPSDVATAVLVTLTWGALVLLALELAGAVPRTRRTSVATAVLGAVVAIVLLAALGVGPGPGPGELTAAVLTVGGIGLAAAGAVAWFGWLVGNQH